jgi:hypothetical protein
VEIQATTIDRLWSLFETENLLGCTAVFLTETSVDIQLRTQKYIPEDSELHTRRRENFNLA